ncbi:integral membrane protein [Tricladium varicosporioides]|nr:integral membrane protein [Hymenoscyphus varicosporioides]
MAQHNHEKKEAALAYGPFGFLNPTVRRYPISWVPPPHKKNESEEGLKDEETEGRGKKQKDINNRGEIRAEDVQREYRTRDNRKGRHALLISPSLAASARYLTPPPTSSLAQTFYGILRMFTWFPIWDVSYLVAVVFTIGSVCWCVNAFFVWLPLQDPRSEFKGEIVSAGGISAFVGATIFEIGSVLLMIEAVNENEVDCFGWALEEILEENGLIRVRPDKQGCTHHHLNHKNLVGKGKVSAEKSNLSSSRSGQWNWIPSWQELRTRYFKEIGFLACLSQMIGATVFWISGFTALPPIYDRLTSRAAQNGVYWLPQVIGGTGFIISGTLFMIETQKRWYLPAPKVLGWHIGAWNLIGGIGFTLCGALGFASANSGCVYQGSLATFWGSWCFLIGSIIQWFESLDKHPVGISIDGSESSVDNNTLPDLSP